MNNTIFRHLITCKSPKVTTKNAVYPKLREHRENDLGQKTKTKNKKTKKNKKKRCIRWPQDTS